MPPTAIVAPPALIPSLNVPPPSLLPAPAGPLDGMLAGTIQLPTGLVFQNVGGQIVANNGGGVVSNNGGSYSLAAAPEMPLPVTSAQVGLLGADGLLLPGTTWVDVDANGRYAFATVPPDISFVVTARVPSGDKIYEIGALARVPVGTKQVVNLSPATSLVAGKAQIVSQEQQIDLAAFDLETIQALVAQITEALLTAAVPDLTLGPAMTASALDRLIQTHPTLSTQAKAVDRNIATPIVRTKVALAEGFHRPEHFAFDPQGNLFVASFEDQTLYKVPAGTTEKQVFATGGNLRWMVGVACDASGNVYVSRRMHFGYNDADNPDPPTETPGTQVFKIDPTGKIVTPLAYTFRSPTGLAFAKDGQTLYVVQGYTTKDGGGELIAYDLGKNQGTVIATGFKFPVGVAVDSRNHVFVSHIRYDRPSKSWLGCISEVDDQQHTSLFFAGDATVTGSNRIEGLAFDAADNLYAASDWAETILKFTPKKRQIDTILPFHQPNGLAFDGQGNLLVGDFTEGTVSRVTP